MNKHFNDVTQAIRGIPPAKHPRKIKKTAAGFGVGIAASVFTYYGLFPEMFQMALFVLCGTMLAGDYLMIAAKTAAAVIKTLRDAVSGSS